MSEGFYWTCSCFFSKTPPLQAFDPPKWNHHHSNRHHCHPNKHIQWVLFILLKAIYFQCNFRAIRPIYIFCKCLHIECIDDCINICQIVAATGFVVGPRWNEITVTVCHIRSEYKVPHDGLSKCIVLALSCVALHFVAFHYIALRSIALHLQFWFQIILQPSFVDLISAANGEPAFNPADFLSANQKPAFNSSPFPFSQSTLEM